MDDFESMINFFLESNRLKKTIRYSSCSEKVRESTAGHSWQVAFMVPIIARQFSLEINIQHAMEIAVVHDLAEYIDEKDYDYYLVSIGELSKEEKDKSEEKVMSDLKDRFNFGSIIYALWREYFECKTPEAKFVKALDKIESHFHIIEREGILNRENLIYQMTFADNAVRNFPQLESLLKSIKKKLKILVESKGLVWKNEYNYPD